jgi:hypothetical protein
MSNQLEQDLHTLRVAAQQREWNMSQDTLKQLLAQVDPLVALGIAVSRAQNFLPAFETYYPQAGWVRELMLQIVSYATAPSDLPLEALTQFPEPGCGNFIMAVFDMARAVQSEASFFERYSYITNAVANSILADLQHTYYSQRRGEYDLMCDPDADPDMAAQVQYAFWLDGNVAQRDADTWLDVADEVEAMLAR